MQEEGHDGEQLLGKLGQVEKVAHTAVNWLRNLVWVFGGLFIVVLGIAGWVWSVNADLETLKETGGPALVKHKGEYEKTREALQSDIKDVKSSVDLVKNDTAWIREKLRDRR